MFFSETCDTVIPTLFDVFNTELFFLKKYHESEIFLLTPSDFLLEWRVLCIWKAQASFEDFIFIHFLRSRL